ncbi:hypothetical protein [Caballeronia sp. INDeC2]|uniref:hypothetical protein n=1 Tax=Caballeronia sp. INDeC2 TaxID=2921747 RepID=UPI00202946D0|nr:hypothetical protein [Caballeronia sp. INDeC2]
MASFLGFLKDCEVELRFRRRSFVVLIADLTNVVCERKSFRIEVRHAKQGPSGKIARPNKKRCDTLSGTAPIRASRSSVKTF